MRVGDQVEAGEPEPIGTLLARMRRERGWSQSQLAAKLCDAAGTPTVRNLSRCFGHRVVSSSVVGWGRWVG
jgi:hypothetical protein